MSNMSFRATFIAFTISIACPAYAGNVDKAAAPDARIRQFIESSHLTAPERVGDFVLESVSYDEKTKYAGAGFRYKLPEHQETRIDVFVYPAGHAPQDQAITSGMVEFNAGLQEAQRVGSIKDLEFVSEEAFPLKEALAPAPSNVDVATSRILAALAATETIGKRLRLRDTLVNGSFQMYSNGYLFYKQLYFFKVRVSAARDRIDDPQFQAVSDRAARSLVQAIEVTNIGDCANAVIEVNPDSDSDAIAEILVRRAAQIQGENCFEDAAKAKLETTSKDARIVDSKFDAKDWTSK